MPRHRKRKREGYGMTSREVMEKAIRNIIDKGQTVRQTAKEFEIPKTTLQRYVRNARNNGLDNIHLQPNWRHNMVFNIQEEEELSDYLLTASKHCHGLSTRQTKELAFQFANMNKKKYPSSWEQNQRAGDDWFYGFMARHPRLSVRKPEATSLSRATCFNRTNVGDFFDNLENVMMRYHFDPRNIYNCDETGLTTVHRPPNIIADKKAKQVGQVTSAERGSLVTMLAAVNAQGNFIPPFLVFPRVHFKEHMINNAPPGTMGVSHQSGWMTGSNFLIWLDHFIKHSSCSKDNPALLIMDNHESHISIDALLKARKNGIVFLTFPPHTSHKLQPLDRTVFGPLKRFYNDACNSWMLAHGGNPMTIYEIAGNLGEAFPRAFCPGNITAGFRVTGIYPFNRNIFGEDEFLSAFVSDRPLAVEDQTVIILAGEDESLIPDKNQTDQPDKAIEIERPGPSENLHFSPDQIRPFPKAAPRKNKTGVRRKRTAILTDTPEKDRIELEQEERDRRMTNRHKTKAKSTRKNNKQQKKGKQTDSETSDSDVESLSDLRSSSDESSASLCRVQRDELKTGAYAIIKCAGKRVVHHYIGKLLEEPDEFDTIQVKFLNRKPTKSQQVVFFFPEKDDLSEVDIMDIEQILPPPSMVGDTERTSKQFTFPGVDFSNYYRLF